MFTKDRTREIRERCDEFLRENDLKLELRRVWEGYRVSFNGYDYRSSVEIVFEGPDAGLNSATWERCGIEVHGYEVETLGDTGWKIYHRGQVGLEEFEDIGPDYPGGMLERAFQWLDRAPLVPNRKGIAGVIDSGALGEIYHDLGVELPDATGFSVVRDCDGEKIEFDLFGRVCKLTFIAADTGDWRDEQVLLAVDGAKITKAVPDAEEIVAALQREIKLLGPKSAAGRLR